MLNHDFIMELLLTFITFMVPIFTTFVIKLVNAKLKNEKFRRWVGLANLAVSAIEETMGSGNGAAKKKAVELWLANKLKGVSTDDIDKLIQAAVGEMNKTLKGGNTDVNK